MPVSLVKQLTTGVTSERHFISPSQPAVGFSTLLFTRLFTQVSGCHPGLFTSTSNPALQSSRLFGQRSSRSQTVPGEIHLLQSTSHFTKFSTSHGQIATRSSDKPDFQPTGPVGQNIFSQTPTDKMVQSTV